MNWTTLFYATTAFVGGFAIYLWGYRDGYRTAMNRMGKDLDDMIAMLKRSKP